MAPWGRTPGAWPGVGYVRGGGGARLRGPPCARAAAAASARQAVARRVLEALASPEAGGEPDDDDYDVRPHLLALDFAPPASERAAFQRFQAQVVARGREALLPGALRSHEEAVPDVDGCVADRCQLTRRPTWSRFRSDREAALLEAYFTRLFTAVAQGAARHGVPIQLSRYDLFHAHLFVAEHAEPGGVGLLFHAMEYPARSDTFPHDLGFCQRRSPLAFSAEHMARRNALFFNGQVCLLDLPQAPPGAAGKPAESGSPLAPLVMEGLEEVQTVYEGDFGRPLADVYCLSPAAGGAPPLLGCSL